MRRIILSAQFTEPFFVGISGKEKSFVEILINRPDGVPQTVAPFPFRGRPAPGQ